LTFLKDNPHLIGIAQYKNNELMLNAFFCLLNTQLNIWPWKSKQIGLFVNTMQFPYQVKVLPVAGLIN